MKPDEIFQEIKSRQKSIDKTGRQMTKFIKKFNSLIKKAKEIAIVTKKRKLVIIPVQKGVRIDKEAADVYISIIYRKIEEGGVKTKEEKSFNITEIKEIIVR